MPKLPIELQTAVRNGLIDWAIREHFSLRITDKLPLAEEITESDLAAILGKIKEVKSIKDFLGMAHTN